jgi:hypothetical protein
VTQGVCARTYQPSLSLRRHPWNTPSLAHSRALCTIFRRVDSHPRRPTHSCTPTLGTCCCPGAECAISALAVCMLTPGPSSAPPLHQPPNAAPSSEELSPQSRAHPFPTPSDSDIHGRVVRHGWAQHGCYDEQCGSNVFQPYTSSIVLTHRSLGHATTLAVLLSTVGTASAPRTRPSVGVAAFGTAMPAPSALVPPRETAHVREVLTPYLASTANLALTQGRKQHLPEHSH